MDLHIEKIVTTFGAIYYALFWHGEFAKPLALLTEAEFKRFLSRGHELLNKKVDIPSNFAGFPKLIRQVRKSLGESQAEFAKRFGSHGNTVSRWETGEYQASYEVLEFVLSQV